MDPILILIIGGGLAFLLLIVGIVVSISSERSLVEERLGRYIDEERIEASGSGGPATSTPLTDWLNRRVQRSSFGENISRELARADIKLKSGEYIALMIIAAFGVALVAWYFGRGTILQIPLIIVGGVLGLFLPRIYVKREQGQRLIRFNGQLADMLNLMVNGLRAGYSTMQAMEAVSKELPPPICDEFRRVVQEMQLGIPMEQALENLLRRIPSEDLDFVITAINVQREVGGNLSEILDNISFTIRERVRIKGEIRVLTSQVRTSGSVLSLIPFFLTIILWFLNPKYLMSVTDGGPYITAGIICVVLGLIGSSYFIMMKIADIEV